MTSPISSPQNIFAIERMSMDGKPPSWLSWFAVALPVALVCDLICWALILLVYRWAPLICRAAGWRARQRCHASAGRRVRLAACWAFSQLPAFEHCLPALRRAQARQPHPRGAAGEAA